MEINKTVKTIKKSFYIYNTPGEYIFMPRFNGLYKITIVGGGGGGYGGGGFLKETFPYQSSGGGGGGTATGIVELETGITYKLIVGKGGIGGYRSSEPNTMNFGQDGGDSNFAGCLFAGGGEGGCRRSQDKYSYSISGRGGEAWGGDKNIYGGDGKSGYYLVGERAYSQNSKSGGDSTHGHGGKSIPYRQLRQRGVSCGGVDGFDGIGYGAGGGGAGFYAYAGVGFSGGSGGCGIIIIEEAETFREGISSDSTDSTTSIDISPHNHNSQNIKD